MLQALYERRIQPDLIVGASAGAINGAFIAGRPQTVETAEELAEIWRGLRRSDVFPISPLTGLLGIAGLRSHLVTGSSLRRLVGEHLNGDCLEEMRVPLHVVAVDVITGEELILSRGPALDAVLASSAIPGVLPPVDWGDRSLFDGGVANNTPISQAIALGARRIYVLPTGHACALESVPGKPLAMGLHAISLMTQRRLIEDVERHRGDAELIVLPPPCPLDVAPVDFSRADELITRAYTDSCAFLDRGGARRPALRMRMHEHGAAAA
jgi:NTE family protein